MFTSMHEFQQSQKNKSTLSAGPRSNGITASNKDLGATQGTDDDSKGGDAAAAASAAAAAVKKKRVGGVQMFVNQKPSKIKK
jgi:hypothetical protein